MINKLISIFNNLLLKLRNFLLNINNLEMNSKILIMNIKKEIFKIGDPSYILDGYKVFSQNDEDGIIQSIFKDIGIENKLFIEIGIGDGIENNSHNLILQNWRGIWIDSNIKVINKLKKIINNDKKIVIKNSTITKENINQVVKGCLSQLLNNENVNVIDFFSIDIDSLDVFCIENLEVIKPRLICIEYNSKFPPPMEISINPNSDNVWNYDDYNGASLSCINNKLSKMGYKLISTNITGSNAFFVLDKYYNKCKTMNQSLKQLYMPPNYNLYNFYQAHKPSIKFLLDIINIEK